MAFQETTIGDVVVKKGARVRHHSNLDKGPQFSIFAVCDDDAGTQWHGEVQLMHQTILVTGTHVNNVQAADEAEKLLRQRLIDLFAAPRSAEDLIRRN